MHVKVEEVFVRLDVRSPQLRLHHDRPTAPVSVHFGLCELDDLNYYVTLYVLRNMKTANELKWLRK
jgi:hypothetical protein